MKIKILLLIIASLLFISCVGGASKNQQISKLEDRQQEPQQPAINSSNAESMPDEHHHSASDPHMKMTALREPKAGDKERAEEIAERARQAIDRYQDYKVALRDGFEILLPNVPQKMYHFNKLAYYAEAESNFNPEHPTSLLYEKTSAGYRLIGVMYTAPANLTENELNERVPLSFTQWHQHINICLPRGSNFLNGLIGQGDKFGLEGSISTREQCEKEGGQFLPRLLGWMVHLYPYEKTPEEMWSVERQMPSVEGHHGH